MLTALVDYVRVTFKTHYVDFVLENIVCIKKEFMQEKETGFYGYIGTYQLDGIKVFWSKEGDERGILVEMSGKGCRQFESFLEAMGKNWFEWFEECLKYNGNFTRFDLALDDKSSTFFYIPNLLGKVADGEAISKFKAIEYVGSYNIKDGESGGTTIYFGSKKSEVYLVMYEKNYEQAKKFNKDPEEFGEWNRYELRLKDKMAQRTIRALVKDQNLKEVSISIINNYLRFAKKEEGVPRQRWETYEFWEDFIGDLKKLSLYKMPDEDFYEKTFAWLKTSVAPNLKMVKLVDDTMGTTDLDDVIEQAEIKDKHLHMAKVRMAKVKDMIYSA